MTDVVEKPVVDTVSIEVDGIAMEVPKGTMIIEATDKAGIHIPRFCYHPKLSIAANCRMCLVDVEKAPKPLPACATPVMDGMKVYTRSRRAIASQQNVMEFLLINHPLDCPICDQGGECELQDVSIGHGHSVSRYVDRKRSVKDENLGALVSTEMTRCIHCTRCVRFLDEIAGTNELGGMGRGDRTFISTYVGRSIDSELSGNIIDLCPVGALTNKPFRFRARSWELRAAGSVSSHDSVGSGIVYHRRQGRILRAVPANNDAINENWLSDRDRWGFHGLYADERFHKPEMKNESHWQKCGWPTAISVVADILSGAKPEETGFLISAQNSNEHLYLAQKFARAINCSNIDHRIRQRDFADDDSRGLNPQLGCSIASLATSDAILLVGSNIRHDQPILGHRIRQAAHAGASVYSINSSDYDFNFNMAAESVCKPSLMAMELAAVAASLELTADGALGKLIASASRNEVSDRIAGGLKQASSGRIILGNDASAHEVASVLRALAELIAGATGSSYGELPVHANSAGATLCGVLPHRQAGMAVSASVGKNTSEMLDGSLKVVVIDGFEPGLDCIQGARLQQVLSDADKVIYLGQYVTDAIREVADLILPVNGYLESGGTMVNMDGQQQTAGPVSKPVAESKDGWKVYRVLAEKMSLQGFDYTSSGDIRNEINSLDTESVIGNSPVNFPLPANATPGQLELHGHYGLYSSDAMVRRSSHLQDTIHASRAELTIHPADAERLEISDGETCVANGGPELVVRVSEQQAEGSAGYPLGVAELVELTAASVVTLEKRS